MIRMVSFFGVLFCCILLNTARGQVCSDKMADSAVKALYKNLFTLQHQFTIFGHQDALAYGVGWKGISKQSDVKSVAGDYPGIYGWDIGHLELQSLNNIDNVSFRKMKQYIREGYQRGGVITISWHLHNPLTGGSSWDTTHGTIASILPGGNKHELFKTWLDRVAAFMNGLKDNNGQFIPVLFRPFHELTGNWFWWCKNVSTAVEFRSLWRFSVNYLRKDKGIHHLLYVYNTANFDNDADFLERYPGDDVVDLVSFDMYQHGKKEDKQEFIDAMRKQIRILCNVAAEKNKIAALAETGMEAVPDNEWWTGVLWPVIEDVPLSYVLVWRKYGYMQPKKKMHYYAPLLGQLSADNFKKFTTNPRILLEKGVKMKKVYQ